MPKKSAGILLYRRMDAIIQVLLVHPGGPFWAKRDEGAWSIVKGEYARDENPWLAARREFEEELGSQCPDGAPIDLGVIVQAGGKRVAAFALEGHFDPTGLRSNSFAAEWPPHSGRVEQFPEVDKAQWFGLTEASGKMIPAQRTFLGRLLDHLALDHHPAGK